MATLRYLGHACFILEQQGTSILFDPFLTGNPLAPSLPELKPTLILVTHGHGDHLGDALDIAKRSGAPILTMVELASYCASKGAKATGANYGGKVAFDFGWVKLVPAWHTSSVPEGVYVGNPCGFVVNFFGKTFYHPGDTCVFEDMKLIAELTPIDVAYLPVGDFYTMGTDEAVKAVQLLQPKIVIPGHYGTFPVLVPNANDFRQSVERATTAQCVVLKPGETYNM